MSVRLVCDHCGSSYERDTLVELTYVTVLNSGAGIHRSHDYPIGQVHEQCIVDFLAARKAKAEEVPF